MTEDKFEVVDAYAELESLKQKLGAYAIAVAMPSSADRVMIMLAMMSSAIGEDPQNPGNMIVEDRAKLDKLVGALVMIHELAQLQIGRLAELIKVGTLPMSKPTAAGSKDN